jgi:hypothetical protein
MTEAEKKWFLRFSSMLSQGVTWRVTSTRARTLLLWALGMPQLYAEDFGLIGGFGLMGFV